MFLGSSSSIAQSFSRSDESGFVGMRDQSSVTALSYESFACYSRRLLYLAKMRKSLLCSKGVRYFSRLLYCRKFQIWYIRTNACHALRWKRRQKERFDFSSKEGVTPGGLGPDLEQRVKLALADTAIRRYHLAAFRLFFVEFISYHLVSVVVGSLSLRLF